MFPFKVIVVLFVKAVDVPVKFNAVDAAQTVTFPPAIVPAVRTTIVMVVEVAH